jgi:tetratricopeptide (TPR) repeat protein
MRSKAGVLAALLLFLSGAFAQDATLERARSLVQSKQGKAAYELLAPLEQQRAGDPNFDYLLGLAAIDAQQYTRAVFALERVLAVQPNHPQARAEIARAYFLMGENKTARREFEQVKGLKPPAEVSANIDRFLDALDARDRARRTGITGFVEATLGYDDNANAATGTGSFAIPALGGAIFTLNPGSLPQRDEFLTLSGGVSGRYGFDDTWGLVGTALFEQRMNETHSQFDTGSITASGGVRYQRDLNEFTVALQAQTFAVDYNRFRDASGVVGQWRRTFGPNDVGTLYGQHTRLSYPGQDFRNTNRSVIGGAWAHVYGGPTAAFVSAYLGKEDPIGQNAGFVGHDLWGVRIGGTYGLTDKWTLAATASYEDRKYLGADPLFLATRHDKETNLRVSAGYALTRDITVTPAISYTDNRSNIVINAYDRTMVSVSVRYDFR